MTCAEFRELAAAYALGMLPEGERRACARHLVGGRPHRGCLDAVAEAQLATAQLAALLPGRAPSPGAWRVIEARVRASTPGPGDPASRGRRLWELADWFVVATVIGLYLYGSPMDTRRRGHFPERERAVRNASQGVLVSGRPSPRP
jgi:anti-sigma-K factor RskA